MNAHRFSTTICTPDDDGVKWAMDFEEINSKCYICLSVPLPRSAARKLSLSAGSGRLISAFENVGRRQSLSKEQQTRR